MRERDKRRHSIIVKGLRATSPTDLTNQFRQIAEEHMGTTVDLTDITLIPGHPTIYRAKIVDDTLRKLVLDKAKQLKGTEHDSVFISRDLTYAQRTELYQRRQARQTQGGPGDGRGGDAAAQAARAPDTQASPATQTTPVVPNGASPQGPPAQGN